MDEDEFSYYLEQLHSANAARAYFAFLTHSTQADIPRLMQAYVAETRIEVQATLVEIIWQQRLPETLEFLAHVLQHSDPKIWKVALDGIVAIDTPQAVAILEAEKTRLLSASSSNATSRLEWIEEAIQQLL